MVIELLVLGSYGLVFILLAFYGFHRSLHVWLYYRYKRQVPRSAGRFDDPPRVTVQLPVYNERFVVERLLEAVARLDYPRERLEIQVLDDSTDDTREICQRRVAALLERGVDIHHLHRTDRTGFKAGALEHGLKSATGELVLILDADFVPPPSLLQNTVHFFTDPEVALVQARWGHLNREQSALTRVQALMLDGHLIIEQTARNRSGRFFNFNGTAGIWRRSAISDSGGWEHDTITEDMDLSFRAQLRGWRFVYLKDCVVPAELPVEMNAFKAQQFRWAKGQIQVARKVLPRVLRAELPFGIKLEAFHHLTNNLAYPLLLCLSLLLLPCLLLRSTHGWREVVLVDLPLFFGTFLSIAAFFLTAQREEGSLSVWRALGRIPLLLAVGIGLCVNQSRAVVEALLGRASPFVRTPKGPRYRSPLSVTTWLELGMAAYLGLTFVLALQAGRYLSLGFVLLFLCGFGYIGGLSVVHALRRRHELSKEREFCYLQKEQRSHR